MAVTFGGDNISTDGSSITKRVGVTIGSDGSSSGGNESEVLSNGTRPTYQQGRPWGMRHITNGQNDTGYWSYSSQTSPDGKRGNYGGSLGAWIDDGTGRFTAPQDGLYQLGSHGIAHGSNNDGRFAVYVNGNKKIHSIAQTQGGNHAGFRGISAGIRLSAGDYVNYAQYSGTGCHTGNWSGFSMTLIG